MRSIKFRDFKEEPEYFESKKFNLFIQFTTDKFVRVSAKSDQIVEVS